MSALLQPAKSVLLRYHRRWVQRRAERWAIRLDRGDLSARERSCLKVWLGDDEHAVALKSAQTLWCSLNASRDVSPATAALRRWGRDTGDFEQRRRRRFQVGAAIAIVGCAAAIALQPALNAIGADGSTSIGEQRWLLLDDGSRVLLNSGSAVDVQYTRTHRRVRLLDGEARFEVAPDAQSPFVVETSGGSVTALGTVFIVRTRSLFEGGGAIVTGVEHRVLATAGGKSTIVDENQQTYWTRFSTPQALGPSRDVNAVAWNAGVLQFEDVSLRDIARELNRYTSTHILVAGQAAELTFSGVFRIGDPVAGLAALESSGQLQLNRFPGVIVVSAR